MFAGATTTPVEMKTPTLLSVAVCLLLLSSCADDLHERCDTLRVAYVKTFTVFNAELDMPRERFSQGQFDKMRQLYDEGCAQPYLGSAPVLCSKTLPVKCPEGYSCKDGFICWHPDVDAFVGDSGVDL